MFLYFDTSGHETIIRLLDENQRVLDEQIWQTDRNHSEELLSKVDSLLNMHKFSKNDLSGIIVNPGPGSYTGIRVGVTTANLLAFSLNIPVLEDGQSGDKKCFDGSVQPVYGNEPVITSSKSRLC